MYDVDILKNMAKIWSRGCVPTLAIADLTADAEFRDRAAGAASLPGILVDYLKHPGRKHLHS